MIRLRKLILSLSPLLLLAACSKDEIKESEILLERLSLNKASATLYVGAELQLEVTFQPADATHQEVEWSSANESVAVVDSYGLVVANAPGSARIRVKQVGGTLSASCLVTVEEVPPEAVRVTGVTLEPSTLSLEKGKSAELVATVLPEDATSKDISWKSSDNTVVTVSDGKVKAVAAGEATITVTTLDGNFTATCAVKVTPKESPEDDPNDDPTGTKGVGEFPSVHIDMSHYDVDRYEYTTTTITFKDPDSWYTSVAELEVEAGVRGRGNMSWSSFSKRPYRIKFAEEESHRVFGMNRNRDWDLIANANDHTLLRNSAGYHLSKMLGFDWTPKVRAVELYMNGEYRGNYILVQHKEVASEKVNIVPATADTAPEEGGYYIEVEDRSGYGDYTSSIYKMPFYWNDPETLTSAQEKYLTDLIEKIEKGLKNKDFTAVWDNLEMGPMVDYFILKELSKDIDGCLRKSNYFSKAPGTKLRMCHVWDFDLGFGNCCDLLYDGHEYSGDAEGWFIKEVGGNYYISGDYYGKGKGWYPAMFQDPNFVQAVKTRWIEVYPELAALPEWIDKQVGYYRAGYDHNFEKWSITENVINRTIEGSYDGEIVAFKEWYTTRLEWMNTQINQW